MTRTLTTACYRSPVGDPRIIDHLRREERAAKAEAVAVARQNLNDRETDRLNRLRQRMDDYRAGSVLPKEYAELHHERAVLDLPRFMEAQNCKVAALGVTNQGWMDSMYVLRVFADAIKGGAVREFRWSDSGGGSWFERTASGGQVLIEASPAGPGHL